MKLKAKVLLSSIALLSCILSISCANKQNKNITVPEKGLEPKIYQFFNALGLPLTELDADNPELLQADLGRVAKAFTDEMSGEVFAQGEDGKIIEAEDSRPFFRLARNMGAYFASQIWKTQLTSPEDVRFFDLSETTNDPDSGFSYAEGDFSFPGIFVNPYASSTDPNNTYLGSILNGVYGMLNPQTGGFFPVSHFYVMEYKLRGAEGLRTSQDVRKYYALVSVPVALENPDTARQVRLVMYAHGGDYGTSPYDLGYVLNKKLAEYVVVAPLFPGEPLCRHVGVQTRGCLKFDATHGLMPDDAGRYNNPYLPDIKFNSMLPIAYPRSPLNEDVLAFLGAHNAISRVMNLPLLKDHTKNPLYNEDFQNNTLLLTLEHPEKLVNVYQDKTSMVPTGLAPQTIGIGLSRGGGVLLGSLGRIGFFINIISEFTPFSHQVKDEDGSTFEFQYPLFNSAAAFYSPTSMLTGKLRLMTVMMLQNKIESIANMPMASDLTNNVYFSNYRNDPSPALSIQPVEEENGKLIPSRDTLTQLATFVASNDITFVAPFIANGLQNWNSYDFDKNTRAPGSLILLHGSQDQVVPVTESTIATTALGTVWAGIYNTPVDLYGNYLHINKFNRLHEKLSLSAIPGVGVAQYTFQPPKEFFNVPCDYNRLAHVQQPEVIYNSEVNRCFGGGYSQTADGTNTVGTFYGHSDASFFSGNLVNFIEPDNPLSIAGLGYNVMKKDQTIYNLGFEGDYKIRFNPFELSFTLPLDSPTFMRYMSEEGHSSDDTVAARKHVFAGYFKPGLDSNTNSGSKRFKPFDVLFSWLDGVVCDVCEARDDNDKKFPAHFGVFHNFAN